MKRIFVIILLLGVSNIILAQNTGNKSLNNDDEFVKEVIAFAKEIENKEFSALMLPGRSINDYLMMLNDSLEEWKFFIEINDFDKQGVGIKGQTYYQITNKKGASYMIERYLNGSIQIIHTFSDGSYYFDELVKALQPYYVTTHNKGFKEYGFKYYNGKYRFIVKRTHNTEMISAEKY